MVDVLCIFVYMNTGVFGDTRRTETHKIYAELSSINKSIGVLNQGICVDFG